MVSVWSQGQGVRQLPDRVVFEYKWVKGKGKSKKLQTKLCGVMRHGPTPLEIFLECSN